VTKTIKDHLANLGQTRELMKNLRLRAFEPFDSFSAYSKTFCSRLGVVSETAWSFQPSHRREKGWATSTVLSDATCSKDQMPGTSFTNRLRPHFQRTRCLLRAIERAQNQLGCA